VLLAPGLARRSPLLRLVSADRQVEVRPPAGRAVLAWLGQRARAEGFELTPGAAQILLELVGEDLARLASEIAKAAAFVDAGGRLAEEGVRQLVGEGRVRQYWELTQALEGGDRPGALRVLEDLLERGEDPVVLLAQITGHVRDVWRIRAGVSAQLPPRRLGELLPRRRPEWAVERLRARAEGWSAATIQGAVRRCFEVELRIKSGGGDPRALLTALVADLVAG
jgi:DNA polymerase-3 subunit delta